MSKEILRWRSSSQWNRVLLSDDSANVCFNIPNGVGNHNVRNSAFGIYNGNRMVYVVIADKPCQVLFEYNFNGGSSWSSGGGQSLTGSGGYYTYTKVNSSFNFVETNDGMWVETLYVDPNFQSYGAISDVNAWLSFLQTPIIPPIVYNFRSVSAITGKLGTFNLPTIDAAFLNSGEAVTGSDGAHIHLNANALISALAANIPLNAETPIIYAGKVDYMSYTIVGAQVPGLPAVITAFRLKFYIGGSSTPFYSADIGGGVNGPKNCYLHFIIDDDNERARLSLIYRVTSTNPLTYSYNGESFTEEQEQQMYLWLKSHVQPDITDSTDNIGNGDEGGDGWQPWNNVPIPKQSNPTKSALNTGFTSMYKVDDAILKSLSDFLWTDSFTENVKKFFSDPREIIIALMLFPVAPSASDTPTEIKAGRISTGVSGYKLLNQYLTIDMGYIEMHEESHTFLDYPPNTRASVYLPYCGEHSLDVNEIQGKTLHLEYTFDFLTGNVCAQISVDGNYIYNFTGECGVQLPTSSEDFSRMYSAIISAGATFGGGLASIAGGGMTAPMALNGASNMLQNFMAMSPEVQYNSGGGSSSGFISNQMPFLRLELPDPLMANGDTSNEDFESSKQYSFLGKPTYQSLTIGECSGFTKCLDAHLVNLTGATTQEQANILRALKDGVLIESGSSTPSDTPTVAGNTVITFLKCSSENNVIGKSWGESTLALEGKLIYNQSITSPKFLVSGNAIGYNYCYIALFKRFYFITDIVCRENGMQEISLSVDVLQSFREITPTTGIIHCKAIIERQKSKGNLYMTDGYMWTKAKKKIVTVPFMGGSNQYVNSAGQQNFERTNNTYVLTIAGD